MTGCRLTAIVGALICGLIAGDLRAYAQGPEDDPALLFTTENGNRSVRVIGFSPDGKRFLTAGRKDEIIHDASNGKAIAELDAHWKNDVGPQITGDGKYITMRYKNGVKFFDWEGKKVASWDAEQPVASVVMTPLTKGFATLEKGVVTARRADGSQIVKLAAPVSVYGIASSADGHVVGWDLKGTAIRVWPFKALKNAVTIRDFKASAIHLNADGSRLAAHGKREARIWNAVDGSLIASLKAGESDMSASAFNREGTLLAVGFKNGQVVVFDVASDDILHVFQNNMQPGSIAFAPDSASLIVGLKHEAIVSGGEKIYLNRKRSGSRSSTRITQGSNRISRTAGYAAGWSLDEAQQ